MLKVLKQFVYYSEKDEMFIAHCCDTNQVGFGGTKINAIKDLNHSNLRRLLENAEEDKTTRIYSSALGIPKIKDLNNKLKKDVLKYESKMGAIDSEHFYICYDMTEKDSLKIA